MEEKFYGGGSETFLEDTAGGDGSSEGGGSGERKGGGDCWVRTGVCGGEEQSVWVGRSSPRNRSDRKEKTPWTADVPSGGGWWWEQYLTIYIVCFSTILIVY
mmetsp:Transcript_32157/g.49161  ORF Transcript_32157/g.49161 Transcript_32157/m.49161 type:complete len:102 (+) Transcript_32157:1280-1585(+)